MIANRYTASQFMNVYFYRTYFSINHCLKMFYKCCWLSPNSTSSMFQQQTLVVLRRVRFFFFLAIKMSIHSIYHSKIFFKKIQNKLIFLLTITPIFRESLDPLSNADIIIGGLRTGPSKVGHS